MKMRVALLSSTGLLLLAACAPQPAVTPEPTTSASTSAATGAPEATASPTPTAAPDSANASDYVVAGWEGQGVYFVSPSRNLRCGISVDDGFSAGLARWGCSAIEHSWKFANANPGDPCFDPPIPCGDGIEARAHERPGAMFRSDVSFPSEWIVEDGGENTVRKLAYGDSVTYAGITCSSAESGITCTDTLTGHGFTISQSRNDIY